MDLASGVDTATHARNIVADVAATHTRIKIPTVRDGEGEECFFVRLNLFNRTPYLLKLFSNIFHLGRIDQHALIRHRGELVQVVPDPHQLHLHINRHRPRLRRVLVLQVREQHLTAPPRELLTPRCLRRGLQLNVLRLGQRQPNALGALVLPSFWTPRQVRDNLRRLLTTGRQNLINRCRRFGRNFFRHPVCGCRLGVRGTFEPVEKPHRPPPSRTRPASERRTANRRVGHPRQGEDFSGSVGQRGTSGAAYCHGKIYLTPVCACPTKEETQPRAHGAWWCTGATDAGGQSRSQRPTTHRPQRSEGRYP